jgi:hypothetical protein
MTNEQILELVKKYFNEGGIRDDGSCTEYYGETIQFIDFAEKIYELGFFDGKIEGHRNGLRGGY